MAFNETKKTNESGVSVWAPGHKITPTYTANTLQPTTKFEMSKSQKGGGLALPLSGWEPVLVAEQEGRTEERRCLP